AVRASRQVFPTRRSSDLRHHAVEFRVEDGGALKAVGITAFGNGIDFHRVVRQRELDAVRLLQNFATIDGSAVFKHHNVDLVPALGQQRSRGDYKQQTGKQSDHHDLEVASWVSSFSTASRRCSALSDSMANLSLSAPSSL